jgi:hypothetical protein
MASFSKDHSYNQEGNSSNHSCLRGSEASEKVRAESMNDGFESSSVQYLQPHPYNNIIKHFREMRCISGNKSSVTVEEFILKFTEEMKEQEKEYSSKNDHLEILIDHSKVSMYKNTKVQNTLIDNESDIQSDEMDFESCPSDDTPKYENFQFEQNCLKFFYPK